MLIARFFRNSASKAGIADFVSLLSASATFSPQTAFDQYFWAGSKHTIRDLRSFSEFLTREVAPESSAGISCQSSATVPPMYVRFYTQFPGQSPLVEWSVADYEPEQVAEAFRPQGAFPTYIARLASAFAASVAIVYSEELLNLSQFASFSSSAGEPVESELAPEIARRLGSELAMQLTSRVHPFTYDPGEIPESLGWLNVWSEAIVQELGHDTVDALPVYHREVLQGLLLLQATDKPPHSDHVEDFQRTAALRALLNLEQAQERKRNG